MALLVTYYLNTRITLKVFAAWTEPSTYSFLNNGHQIKELFTFTEL